MTGKLFSFSSFLSFFLIVLNMNITSCCEKQNTGKSSAEPPVIVATTTVSENYFKSGILLPEVAGPTEIDFKTNYNWSAILSNTGKENNLWCHISSNQGVAGATKLVLNVDTNNEIKDRSVVLTLVCDSVRQKIVINQKHFEVCVRPQNGFLFR